METKMCEDIDIKDKDKFLEFIAEKNIKTVLLGNGFSLSHPEFGNCFTFKLNRIRQKLKKITKKKLATIVSSNDNKFDPQCPETSLEGFRKAIIEITVNEYMQKFLEKCHANDKDTGFRNLYSLYTRQELSNTTCFSHCTNFLNNFDAIFTTNYDPIIYFEILKCNDQLKKYSPENQENKIFDNFEGKKFSKLDNNFEDKCKHKRCIYYLHGSWFIRYHSNDKKLSKLSFEKNSKLTIKDIFNWEKGLVPYLIFEDRPWCKEHFTKEEKKDSYFQLCFEALRSIDGPLLVFGDVL